VLDITLPIGMRIRDCKVTRPSGYDQENENIGVSKMNAYRWEDLEVGMKHDFEATFTEEMAQEFARISGDVNPLHVDREYAIGAGFPGPVLFGMLTSSLYSQLVGVYLPGKYALLEGMNLDLNSPVFAGEKLLVTGEIVFKSASFKRMEIKSRIRKVNGQLVSKALIRVGMHA
jgi:3-hydroxybutyryl-CoA dehydratase